MVQCRGPGRPRENNCGCSQQGILCHCNARTAYIIPGHRQSSLILYESFCIYLRITGPRFISKDQVKAKNIHLVPDGEDIIDNAVLTEPYTEQISSNPKGKAKQKKPRTKRAKPYPVNIAPRLEHDNPSDDDGEGEDLQDGETILTSETPVEPKTSKHKSCCSKKTARKPDPIATSSDNISRVHSQVQTNTLGFQTMMSPTMPMPTQGINTLSAIPSSNMVATSSRLRADSIKLLGAPSGEVLMVTPQQTLPGNSHAVVKHEYMPTTTTFQPTTMTYPSPMSQPGFQQFMNTPDSATTPGHYQLAPMPANFHPMMTPNQMSLAHNILPQGNTHYGNHLDCAMSAAQGIYPIMQNNRLDGCTCLDEASCTCIGCGTHPRNPATIAHVMDALDHQTKPEWNDYWSTLQGSNATTMQGQGMSSDILDPSSLGDQQGLSMNMSEAHNVMKMPGPADVMNMSGPVDGTNMSGSLNVTNMTDVSGMNMAIVNGMNMANINGMNMASASNMNMTDPSGMNMTDPSGMNMTNVNGMNMTNVSGMNMTVPSGIIMTNTGDDELGNIYLNTGFSNTANQQFDTNDPTQFGQYIINNL
jgi:hypothetical protein